MTFFRNMIAAICNSWTDDDSPTEYELRKAFGDDALPLTMKRIVFD